MKGNDEKQNKVDLQQISLGEKGGTKEGRKEGTWLSRPTSMTERLGRSVFLRNPVRAYSWSNSICGERRKRSAASYRAVTPDPEI